MNPEERRKNLKGTSRRRFLKGGTALAAMSAAGAACGQVLNIGQNQRTEYIPEDQVPKNAVLRDPWTGEMMRDAEGNLIVDWTGTPQWKQYQENIRAFAGNRYGAKVDTRLYGVPSKYVTSYRLGYDGGSGPNSGTPTMPDDIKTYFFSLGSPVQDQLGIITPNGLHFTDEHGEVPDIDPRQHRLTISGMVDRPTTFTMEDLMRLPSVSRFHTLECNTDGATMDVRKAPWATAGDCFREHSCSEWTGVLMSTLLDVVGVKKGAKWFYASAADEYNQTWAVPMWKAMDDAIIAYGMNGEALRVEQGFPVRLRLPGFQGTMNIKRLRRIKVTDELTLFHRLYDKVQTNGKTTWFTFEMPPQSCILRPSGGHRLTSRGFYEIRGIAWSGAGKVTKVEVTVDGGKNWQQARLQEPVFPKCDTRFTLPWNWNGQETTIAARCYDEKGSTQPTTPEAMKLHGVDFETFKKTIVQRNNIMQPWKIDKDGRVTNALYSV